MSYQRLKTWKDSRDPGYEAKKALIEDFCAIPDGEVMAEDGEPEVVFFLDEFGPLRTPTAEGPRPPLS